jgi:hypothetical protein
LLVSLLDELPELRIVREQHLVELLALNSDDDGGRPAACRPSTPLMLRLGDVRTE